MSKTKLLTVAVIGLLLMNLGMLGFLFFHKPFPPPHSRPGSGEEGPKKIIAQRLRFDQAQTAQYEQLVEQHLSAIHDLESRIRDAKNDLYASLQSAQDTPTELLINRIADLQKQVETVNYNHFIGIKNLCKPAQLPLFNSLTTDLSRFFAPHGDRLPPPPGN